jgi:lipoprotein-releasing system ATP-binding protein
VPPEALLSVAGLAKGFGTGPGRVEIFRGLDLEVFAGDFLSIVGPSGCGKSTLLHLFAGLDEPDAGEVSVSGTSWRTLSPEKKAALRGEAIGFVFQLHHLLPELTAEERRPASSSRSVPERKRTRARRGWNVGWRIARRAPHASGGERQWVAIARAVIREFFCDGRRQLTRRTRERRRLTGFPASGAVIPVTHDPALAASRVHRPRPTGSSRRRPPGVWGIETRQQTRAVAPDGGATIPEAHRRAKAAFTSSRSTTRPAGPCFPLRGLEAGLQVIESDTLLGVLREARTSSRRSSGASTSSLTTNREIEGDRVFVGASRRWAASRNRKRSWRPPRTRPSR